MGWRSSPGAKLRRRPRRRRRPPPARAAAASILASIAADPGHVAAALCQMATLAHVAGRLQKRNDSVEVAADLLAQARRSSGGAKVRRAFATGRLVC